MRLSPEAIIILNTLSVKPMQIRELAIIFGALDSKLHQSYHSLEVTININLKRLMQLKLLKRNGNRGAYIYHLTNKGLKLLIQKQLKKLLLIS